MTTQQDAPALELPQLIELVDALTMLIEEENTLLRGGAPTSLAATLALKVKLGGELERRVRTGMLNSGGNPVQRMQLARRSVALQAAMAENSANLRAAMLSTRRRVDAIMRALREQETRPGRYDNSGRRLASQHPPATRSGRLV